MIDYPVTERTPGLKLAKEASALVYHIGGNVNWCSHYGKQYGSSAKKLPCHSAIPFLGI